MSTMNTIRTVLSLAATGFVAGAAWPAAAQQPLDCAAAVQRATSAFVSGDYETFLSEMGGFHHDTTIESLLEDRRASEQPDEDDATLGAELRAVLETFPEKVQVEIVDWRRKEGLERRNATGLVCAGVMINDKNAFEVEVDGKADKVLFVRGLGGEWTKADLEAAVRKELALAK